MRKLILSGLVILTIAVSCKTSQHKCDAYGMQDEDIFKEDVASDKKYVGFEVIK